MTQDDRMETITDPAVIRACDEPDPFRRNPVAQTGPDDPWRFTRFVADDHECVIVRDEYDEPAPFGSCSTHRRALSSPVALGCTTSARVGAAMALDLDAVEAEFLRQCGGCDAGLMVGCTCSQRDFRPTMLALVAEVRRLTEESEARRVREMDAVDLAMSERARAEAAEALDLHATAGEVARLRRNLTATAQDATDAKCARDAARREADQLRHLLGSHADGHRCTCTMTDPGVYHGDNMHPPEWEQDPWCPTHPHMPYVIEEHRKALARAEAAEAEVVTLRAKVAAVEALTVDWPCSDDTCDGDCTGCAYASDLRAALAVTTGEGEHVAREVFTADGIPFVSCLCTNAKSPTRWLTDWLIRYDPDDGEPYGEICDCEIGDDHDATGEGE